jgi:hypothetical protein
LVSFRGDRRVLEGFVHSPVNHQERGSRQERVQVRPISVENAFEALIGFVLLSDAAIQNGQLHFGRRCRGPRLRERLEDIARRSFVLPGHVIVGERECRFGTLRELPYFQGVRLGLGAPVGGDVEAGQEPVRHHVRGLDLDDFPQLGLRFRPPRLAPVKVRERETGSCRIGV